MPKAIRRRISPRLLVKQNTQCVLMGLPYTYLRQILTMAHIYALTRCVRLSEGDGPEHTKRYRREMCELMDMVHKACDRGLAEHNRIAMGQPKPQPHVPSREERREAVAWSRTIDQLLTEADALGIHRDVPSYSERLRAICDMLSGETCQCAGADKCLRCRILGVAQGADGASPDIEP